MSAYYNELDPYPAAWLENLAAKGLIAPGRVDRRSIRDVAPEAFFRASQAHFFAGLGGWSYALRLAGWPDDRPVWTGSCPCQPFSAAGRRKGFDDDRHLWPDWFSLIRQCRPPVVFGEQVASPDGLAWFDAVSADLEGAGYAVGAADLSAAGIGAPHIRQRLYFVAIADLQRREGLGLHLRERRPRPPVVEADRNGTVGSLADGGGTRLEVLGVEQARRQCSAVERGSAPSGLGNTGGGGSGRDTGAVPGAERESPSAGQEPWCFAHEPFYANPWADVEWLDCRDGKRRPTRPGLFPLAHGVSARVGRLRAYGNAIVPQVAAVFVRAVMDGLGAAGV